MFEFINKRSVGIGVLARRDECRSYVKFRTIGKVIYIDREVDSRVEKERKKRRRERKRNEEENLS